MRLYRCVGCDRDAAVDGPNGPLWFPRVLQGDGRHDNPAEYGCLYLADRAVSGIVEHLAPFRGQRLVPAILRSRGFPLSLVTLELDDRAVLIDLDNPTVLIREELRPSRVATRDRSVTQPQALDLYRRHPDAAGLRWWSTWEALWTHVTLFDRVRPRLRVLAVRELTLEVPEVVQAADFFGLRV